MWTRITAGLVSLFWAVMMALLVRSEFGSQDDIRARVPPALVWERILTAPDQSTLEIRQGTNRLGFCRWSPALGQESEMSGGRIDGREEVEGMVKHLSYYSLDLDGTMALPDFSQRASFDIRLKLDTNRNWQEFRLRLTMRPDEYELNASAAQQVLRFHMQSGADGWERTIRFAELQNPQRLLAEFGGPALPLLLGGMGLPLSTNALSVSSAFRWQAHRRNLMLGKNPVPAYRLRGTLLNRHEITLYVSPIGEILRVELPRKVVLVNNAMPMLREPK